MLRLTIPEQEVFNDDTQEFSFTKEVTLQLEHSLVSISKWEAKWHIPFLRREPMTREQTIDYIRCMTITQNVPKEAYEFLTNENINDVMEYINDSMTATTVTISREVDFLRCVTVVAVIESLIYSITSLMFSFVKNSYASFGTIWVIVMQRI